MGQADVIRNFTRQLASLGLREEVFRSLAESPVRAYLLMGEYREVLSLLRMASGQGAPSNNLRLAETFYYLGMFADAAGVYAEIYPQPLTVTFVATDDFLLVHAADAARRMGAVQEAAAYRDADDRLLTSLANAGVAIQGDLAYHRALLDAYDGRQDEAASNLIIAIAVSDYWRQAASDPLLTEILMRADVQAALQAQTLVVDRQRNEVLRMLCGPDPASPNFRPAPGTCERLESGLTVPDAGR